MGRVGSGRRWYQLRPDGGAENHRQCSVRLVPEAGLDDVQQPWHSLRHTGATDFLLNGGNPGILMQLLRHTSMAMTMRYVTLAAEHLRGALDRLEKMDPTQTQIVVLRFFAGLNNKEIAEALGISRTTVKREWTLARLWLFRELGGGGEPEEGPS